MKNVEEIMFVIGTKHRLLPFGEKEGKWGRVAVVRYQTQTVRFRTLLLNYFTKPLPGKGLQLGTGVET